jgi:predicted dehydrogenase
MSQRPHAPETHASRRTFLKAAGAATAASMATGLTLDRAAHAAGSDTLRIGLIGCGGRGTGAAGNALSADSNSKLVAVADAFPDRLTSCLRGLGKKFEGRADVAEDHQFVGLDCGERLLQSDVDVVLLAEPPQFRPRHLAAAIKAGKHVFCEKPVAVDAPGIRSVLASAAAAKEKNLNVVSGLCWRYHYGVRETMKRVLDGAIGTILSMQLTYNTGLLWERPRQPDWNEMQFQLRNWYYFTWLSGDFNVEQHVHTLDKGLWAMGDRPPQRAWGLGGRQVRTDAKFGNIFDHHAVVFEWPEAGASAYSFCRQMANCWNDNGAVLVGTKGRANVLKHVIEGENAWRYDGPGCNMYDVEHQELFAAIRNGKPINNGQYMADSTMMGILGRTTTYTGKLITWDEIMQGKEDLSPSAYTFDGVPPIMPDAEGKYPIAIPGATKLA